jgi:hypothetical protein
VVGGSAVAAHRLLVSTLSFAGYTALMLTFERRMRRAGGPGIIPFELAGTPERAEAIMALWGADGQRAARWSTWLDFGYMLNYGALTATLVDRARHQFGHPPAVAAMVVPAVAADALEGLSLLKVLGHNDIATYSRRARTAALSKFAVLGVTLLYTVAAAVATQVRPLGRRDHT